MLDFSSIRLAFGFIYIYFRLLVRYLKLIPNDLECWLLKVVKFMQRWQIFGGPTSCILYHNVWNKESHFNNFFSNMILSYAAENLI